MRIRNFGGLSLNLLRCILSQSPAAPAPSSEGAEGIRGYDNPSVCFADSSLYTREPRGDDALSAAFSDSSPKGRAEGVTTPHPSAVQTPSPQGEGLEWNE